LVSVFGILLHITKSIEMKEFNTASTNALKTTILQELGSVGIFFHSVVPLCPMFGLPLSFRLWFKHVGHLFALSYVVSTKLVVVLQFLWHWRRVLNNYNVVEQEEVANVSEGGHYYGNAAIRPVVLQLGHPNGSSETTLLPIMSSAASRMKPIP